MVQLQHIDVADRHLAVEGSPVRPSISVHLAGPVEPAISSMRRCLLPARRRTPASRTERRSAGCRRARAFRLRTGRRYRCRSLAVDRLQLSFNCDRLEALSSAPLGSSGRLQASRRSDGRARRRPTQMRLQDLADIHARRHAQRVQHDIDLTCRLPGTACLPRDDLGDHALVAMPAGHLVAGLQLALHRDEDLDHLHHARRQLVAALKLLDLVLEPGLQRIDASRRMPC